MALIDQLRRSKGLCCGCDAPECGTHSRRTARCYGDPMSGAAGSWSTTRHHDPTRSPHARPRPVPRRPGRHRAADLRRLLPAPPPPRPRRRLPRGATSGCSRCRRRWPPAPSAPASASACSACCRSSGCARPSSTSTRSPTTSPRWRSGCSAGSAPLRYDSPPSCSWPSSCWRCSSSATPASCAEHRQQLIVLDRAFTDEPTLSPTSSSCSAAQVPQATVQRVDLVNDTTLVDVRFGSRQPPLPAAAPRAPASARR